MENDEKEKGKIKKKIVLKTPDFHKEKMDDVNDALKTEGDEHLKDLIHLPLGNSSCCC